MAVECFFTDFPMKSGRNQGESANILVILSKNKEIYGISATENYNFNIFGYNGGRSRRVYKELNIQRRLLKARLQGIKHTTTAAQDVAARNYKKSNKSINITKKDWNKK